MEAKSLAVFVLCLCSPSTQADLTHVKERMTEDVRQGKPLIAHVTVALCDNTSQGIIPVGNGLCDGDAPRGNLYWGALYGIKTYFAMHKGWTQIDISKPTDKRILDRVAFHRMLDYEGLSVPVYIVADAWRGKDIRSAMTNFLDRISGQKEAITLTKSIQLKENAHIIAYIGHNGLMDFSLPKYSIDTKYHSTSSAIILACKSDAYFDAILNETKTHKLLTTSGFMAPEAYTLEAAITRWFSGGSAEETHLAASAAYSQYQKAKLAWSKTLFLFDQ